LSRVACPARGGWAPRKRETAAAVRPNGKGMSPGRDRTRQGWRVRAYRDVFTACLDRGTSPSRHAASRAVWDRGPRVGYSLPGHAVNTSLYAPRPPAALRIPAPLAGPGLAIHGEPARREKRPLDVSLFPPRPCGRGSRQGAPDSRVTGRRWRGCLVLPAQRAEGGRPASAKPRQPCARTGRGCPPVETVRARDGAFEPTGTYSRRVSTGGHPLPVATPTDPHAHRSPRPFRCCAPHQQMPGSPSRGPRQSSISTCTAPSSSTRTGNTGSAS